MMRLPEDFDAVVEEAWEKVRVTPGFLTEPEARALIMMAACTPASGRMVEIGSFKGRSTVGLGTVAARYGLGQVIAIDPHTAPSVTCPDLEGKETSFDEFLAGLKAAGVEKQVEVHRAFSQDVAREWTRPIRLLWIDGDHTYEGAKRDFDLFSPFVAEGGVIALHDALHEFEGPIRVFVEDILRSDKFGPAGFFGSIAWAQFRPEDGARFASERKTLAKKAARVIPSVLGGRELKGLAKQKFKLMRSMVPRKGITVDQWMRKCAL